VLTYNSKTGATLTDNNIRNQVFQVYLGLGFKH
jgi:hypothetical protein